MKIRETSWRASAQRATALAVVLALAPLPAAAAAPADPSPRPGPIRASVAKITVKDAPKMPTARRSEARSAAQPTPGQDRSFFKSGPGIIAIAVMAIGAGYAIYSTQNDRIKSPGKE